MEIKFDMVGIVVENMNKSLDFYRLLGLEIPKEANQEPHVEVKQGELRLAFDTLETIKSIYGEWEKPTGHRLELAFLCEDVDQVYQTLINNGYIGFREPWDAFWGQRYAIVQDPDDNLISLFAPLSSTHE
ncbi:VOC family protein [Shimazuella kribbensis]|uniref:VOC family protein n=1 Tax=Shimazuella kribbensis TaxID=139808 RepID=UPI000420A9EC|nr:VOC family protein [Shimazuella kribbensis]